MEKIAGAIAAWAAEVGLRPTCTDAFDLIARTMKLGSGVSGVLARAAGPRLQQAMSVYGSLEPDGIVETSSFGHTLVSRVLLCVLSAVGIEAVVRAGYRNVLRVAIE